VRGRAAQDVLPVAAPEPDQDVLCAAAETLDPFERGTGQGVAVHPVRQNAEVDQGRVDVIRLHPGRTSASKSL
jgi:hypothetical protein